MGVLGTGKGVEMIKRKGSQGFLVWGKLRDLGVFFRGKEMETGG